jgi:phosphoenolpyruvate carboxykinase (ATP)
VTDTVLNPREAWSDKAAYDDAARQLAASFQKNYDAVLSGRDLGAMDG